MTLYKLCKIFPARADKITLICGVVTLFCGAQAAASTATFITPTNVDGATTTALSTSGDNAGFLVGLNQTLSIRLDNPIGATASTSVSIFTLPPDSGNARATISFGSYNNGSPIIVLSRNVNAGSSSNINNLFQRGCGLLGGCDFIEIITNRTRRGAEGVEVDYIVVDGVVVQLTSPAPEPSIWAMLILAFAGCALRLKQIRRSQNSAPVLNRGPMLASP